MKLAFLAHEVQLAATPVRAVETDIDVHRVGCAAGLRAYRLEADIAAEWADSIPVSYNGKFGFDFDGLHDAPSLVCTCTLICAVSRRRVFSPLLCRLPSRCR